jgi:hypothetical protein
MIPRHCRRPNLTTCSELSAMAPSAASFQLGPDLEKERSQRNREKG